MNTSLTFAMIGQFVLAAPLFFAYQTFAQEDGAAQPAVEVGLVNWGRDFEQAQTVSSKTGKPILLLFQEIPGCQGCQDYGQQVLSHPLMVEASEELFVPSLVYNNREGVDAEMLKRFKEPSWNYPVVRYLDQQGKDLIPRKDKIWEVQNTAQRMVQALTKAARDVPEYLQLMAVDASELETATFAMHCYWEGEAALGSLDGVLGTRSAWLDGKEVVRVDFDPSVIDYESLVKNAKSMECASTIFTHSDAQLKTAKQHGDQVKRASEASGARDAKASDQKYYLRNSLVRVIPMTPAQASKVNGALAKKEAFEKWLSPRQQATLARIEQLSPAQLKQLMGFQCPDNENELAAYHAKLMHKLNSF